MNGTLLSLLVVAAIGVVLWAMLFAGNKLLDKIISGRTSGDSQSAKDLVNFVRQLPGLTSALNMVTTSTQAKHFAQLLHESRIDHGTPDRASIEAKATAASLLMLFVSGLIRVATDGLVATELGREVKRRIDARQKQFDLNTSLPLAVMEVAPAVLPTF